MKSALSILCLTLAITGLTTDSPASDFPLATLLQENALQDTDTLVAVFRDCQERYLSILPPGAKTFTMPEGILAFDETGFQREKWFRKLEPTGQGTIVFTMAEDPASRNMVLRNTEGVTVGTIQAPMDYDPTWFATTIYPDLFSGRYPTDQVTAILEQYDPARLIVQYTLVPLDDVDTYAATLDVLATVQPDAMMTMLGMDAPESVEEIIVGLDACDSTSAVINVYVPAGFTNRIDVFSSTNLINARWNLAAACLIPVDGIAVWTNYHSSTTNAGGGGGGGGGIPPPGEGDGEGTTNAFPAVVGFFAAANADLTSDTDSDQDGVPAGRERFVYLSDPGDSDSDNDTIADGVEVANHTDPINPDTTRPTAAFLTPTSGQNLWWKP